MQLADVSYSPLCLPTGPDPHSRRHEQLLAAGQLVCRVDLAHSDAHLQRTEEGAMRSGLPSLGAAACGSTSTSSKGWAAHWPTDTRGTTQTAATGSQLPTFTARLAQPVVEVAHIQERVGLHLHGGEGGVQNRCSAAGT